ncbi:hypothetical protein TCAL_09237 [Tigriopus californicus]|uniref:glycerophosphodiester phosphodiesterase n=1 Tax=Tigriopus californicus TaxID=6832 RepID=A0A553NP28_TIGCA|nr:uncharacterized protein LOC131879709 [Tigriopus californicus]XP_059082072.1 uncharacterized protein LOC131879709 [Tigriopus californicus]TRY67191.1 hypothetical protein TCAL_09237 [Tigriopus californicus]|eukprot:TCALIF_09237-PA protein Name:"Similar to glpQ Glycerophosphoryl diester phosphodiesterase (Escherichia coli (strain K12))" AED:0.00 eAED:0.00 QI:368/1/1/1/0.83/0.71/7/78/406
MYRKKSLLVFGIALFLLILGTDSTQSLPFEDEAQWHWTFGDSSGLDSLPNSRPLIIAHRGASGMFPEHTMMAYEEAIYQGADLVECDIVVTKDLQLVCSHEAWIDAVSNVNNSTSEPQHEDFTNRITTYIMDDDDPNMNWNDHGPIKDYFTYDFTLDELITLRRKQVRTYRDPSYNWKQTFVTFEEYLDMCKENNIGIYPEIKLGAATNKILRDRNHNVTIEELVLAALDKTGYNKASDPCFVQTFELSTIKKLNELKTNLRTIFLFHANRTSDEDLQMYKDLGVYGLGLDKDLLVIKDDKNHISLLNEDLVHRIHALGMDVHVYTFRNEWNHLNWDYGQDPYMEYETFLDMGIDGYFTDFPASLRNFFTFKELQYAKNSGLVSQPMEKTYAFLCVLSVIICNWKQ